MAYVLCLILGYVVGGVITGLLVRKLDRGMHAGTLKMDCSTGDPHLFLVLDKTMEEVLVESEVTLKVDNTPFTRE